MIEASGKYRKINSDFLELFLPLDIVARKLLVPFLFLVACAAFFFKITYSLPQLAFLLAMFFCVSSASFWIIRKGVLPADVVYFSLMVIDSVLATFTLYFSGGIESSAYVLYGIIGILAGLTLPLWGIFSIIIVSAVLYFGELLMESCHLIPHIAAYRDYFSPEMLLHSPYIIVTPLANFSAYVAAVFMCHTVAEILINRRERLDDLNQDLDKSSKLLVRRDLEANDINRQLDEKIHELEELKTGLEAKVKERTGELEEAKAGLEIKVTERTTELKKERASLEEKVKDRTRELESAKAGLEEKVAELEEFHDLTVGRELKMIELEKEIEELKHPAGENK